MITQRAAPGSSARGMQAPEVAGGVPGEVEVEVGEGALHDAPHRLAEVRQEAAGGEVARAAVGGQQLGVVDVVVDGEVAEVEGGVAHPRVLPVDDPQAAV